MSGSGERSGERGHSMLLGRGYIEKSSESKSGLGTQYFVRGKGAWMVEGGDVSLSGPRKSCVPARTR